MRLVGRPRTPSIEPDPATAFRRGRALDRSLASGLPPVARGITRGTHATLNAEQDARSARAARHVDAARRPFAGD